MISIEILIPELGRRLHLKAGLSETARHILTSIGQAIGEEFNDIEWEMISTDTYKRFEGNVNLMEAGVASGGTILLMKR